MNQYFLITFLLVIMGFPVASISMYVEGELDTSGFPMQKWWLSLPPIFNAIYEAEYSSKMIEPLVENFDIFKKFDTAYGFFNVVDFALQFLRFHVIEFFLLKFNLVQYYDEEFNDSLLYYIIRHRNLPALNAYLQKNSPALEKLNLPNKNHSLLICNYLCIRPIDRSELYEFLASLITVGADVTTEVELEGAKKMIVLDLMKTNFDRISVFQSTENYHMLFFHKALMQIIIYNKKQEAYRLTKSLHFSEDAVNLKDKNGQTFLHIIANDSNKLLRNCKSNYLLMHGADVNIADHTGQTPLHIAIKSSDRPLISLFLGWDANVMVKNNKNISPLELFIANDNLLCFFKKIVLNIK